jgi:sialic acid synthase SpsE
MAHTAQKAIPGACSVEKPSVVTKVFPELNYVTYNSTISQRGTPLHHSTGECASHELSQRIHKIHDSGVQTRIVLTYYNS